jgi:organic radical activating enzyme
LGWQRAYPELLNNPKMRNLKEITFETNGTQKLAPEFKNYLADWTFGSDEREITFSVSAKLPCSGEKWEEAILPEVVCEYEQVGTAYLKFVVTNEQDVQDAERAVSQYREAGFKGHVYIMPVGGVERVYALNNRAVADMAMRKGWRYSDRLQVPLFKNEWGT